MVPTPLPAETHEVPRERLVRLVTATEPGGICALVAAPGYGVSTLLGQVERATSDPVLRCRLAAGDDLWERLAHALSRTGDTGTAATPAGVLAAAAGAGPRWLMLDLDDNSSPGRDRGEAVDLLAASLPAEVRLAVAAHRSLPWSPGVAGRVRELTEPQLAFDLDEAVELLPDISVATVETVWELTEGWAAGLRAAASHSQLGGSDVAAWLRGAGADRLLGAWLDRLPAEPRRFLIATAVLGDLDPAVCDAVAQRHDSAAMLDSLARDHCFVAEAHADAGPAWRRHPLLTALLRRRTVEAADLVARHSRAADWYSAHGDVDAAMHHLLGAGRLEDAGGLLRQQESSLFMTGRGGQALDWYDQLPEEAHGTRALRLLRIAWGQALSGEPEEAEIWLARVKALDPSPEADPMDQQLRREGEEHVLTAYLATFRGDAATMAAAAERAIAAFDAASERDSEQLAFVLRVRGLQWSGEHDRAARMLDSLESRPFPNDMIRECSLAAVRACRWRQEGRIHDAHRVADRSVRWVRSLGLEPAELRTLHAYGEWAAVQLERGFVDLAEETLHRTLDTARGSRRVGEQSLALLDIARLERLRRDAGAALRAIREARALLTASAPGTPLLHDVDAAEARLRIDTGDAVRAERLIRGLPAGPDRTLLLSRLLLARGADGRRGLSTFEPTTPREAAQQHLLLSWATVRRGVRLAEAHLLRAADIATETGQALLLLEASPPVLDLAVAAARRHGDDGLLTLLAVLNRDRPAAPPEVAAPLSPGEMELLALLPGRETVASIAGILNVTANTVKTRLKRLYRKLGASSRDEAIEIARRHGLL